MKFIAEQISGILEGEIVGNPSVEVNKLSKIEEGEKGSLTFLSNPKYTSYIYSTKASIVIVNKDFIPEQNIESTLIKVDDAYKAFSKLLEYYNLIKLNKNGIETINSDSVTWEKLLWSFYGIGENVTERM